MIDCNEWRTEKRHECANMGKVKQLELWRQLYRTSLPVWDLENFRPMDFCWHKCTCTGLWLWCKNVLLNCWILCSYVLISWTAILFWGCLFMSHIRLSYIFSWLITDLVSCFHLHVGLCKYIDLNVYPDVAVFFLIVMITFSLP